MNESGAGSWQLRIELLEVRPIVWRRMIVPETIRLRKLHQALQIIFGWRDSHPHEFIIRGKRYSSARKEMAAQFGYADERRALLRKTLGATVRSFDYIYDFCDDWHHVVIVEERWPPGGAEPAAILCSEGQNASPPDGIGSARGYAEFLDSIGWADGRMPATKPRMGSLVFDPLHFDLQRVNAELCQLGG